MEGATARSHMPLYPPLTDMSLLLQPRFRGDVGPRLRACLRHHWYGPNPSYRELLQLANFKDDDLPEDTEDLSRLPLTDKDFLRQGNFPEHPNGPIYKVVSTSGSTQTAVAIPHNFTMSHSTLFENFLRLMALNDINDFGRFYGIGHWIPGETSSGSFITFDFMKRAFPVSCEMAPTSDPLDRHEETLLSGVDTVATAPGFLVHLANYMSERGRAVHIRNIILGGAPLLQSDARHVQSAFSPEKMIMFYPTTDAGGLGAQIGEGGDYVSFPETHVMEVVHSDGGHVAIDEEGDVAVTALDSLAAPIIRYLVGDRVVFLGRTDDGRVSFRSIKRTADVIVGDGKIPFGELDRFRDALLDEGLVTNAFQMAKRKNRRGQDQIIMRLEGDVDTQAAHAAVIAVLRRNPHMMYLLDDGELPEPVVEVFSIGGLTKGRFKIPVYVDETESPEGGPR